MISKQTLEMVAEELWEANPTTGGAWVGVQAGRRVKALEFAAKVIAIARLPVEIELRQRLLSQRGRDTATDEINSYLPEGFLWPEEHGIISSDEVFIAALMAALAQTSGTVEG